MASPITYTWNTDLSGNWNNKTGLWARSSGTQTFPGDIDPAAIVQITATGSLVPFDYTISEDVTTKIGALTVNSADPQAIATLAFDIPGVALTVTGLTTLTAGAIDLSTTGALTTGTFLGNGGTFTESSGALTVTGAGATGLSVTAGTFALVGGAVTVANNASFTGGTDTISGGTFTANNITVGGVSALLTLSGGTVTATTSNANASSIGISDTINMSGGAILDLTDGGANVNAGLKNDGTLIGAGTVKGVLSGAGFVELTGGKLELTSNIAGNSNLNFAIGTTGFLQVDGTLGSGNTFTFLAPSGVLAYNNPATNITENVVGLNVGSSATVPTNFLDFTQSGVTVNGSNAHTGSTATVSLSDGSILSLSGITAPGTWLVNTVSDGSAGTDIFLSAVCFLRGTRILTPAGEVPVEDLSIGDCVVTVSGAERSIKWIGRRGYITRLVSQHARDSVLPIRFARGSLGDALPKRELYVSPEHAMCLDGVLIRARHLVNGASIAYCDSFSKIEYFHIELPTHDVIYAEGAASESWLDCGNRNIFSNVLDCPAHDLSEGNTPARPCLPFVTEGRALDAIREKLTAYVELSGFEFTADPDLRLMADDAAIRGECSVDSVYTFELAACPTRMAIGSRVSVPADVVPGSTDRRVLGVCVVRIVLKTASLTIKIDYNDLSLCEGFYQAEVGQRWTAGYAIIPVHLLACPAGPVTVEVHWSGKVCPTQCTPTMQGASLRCPLTGVGQRCPSLWLPERMPFCSNHSWPCSGQGAKAMPASSTLTASTRLRRCVAICRAAAPPLLRAGCRPPPDYTAPTEARRLSSTTDDLHFSQTRSAPTRSPHCRLDGDCPASGAAL